ncbi:unnamed protein product [Brachionus calyciflorus]|uniref:HTH CENPB-type domain-containing protein n=1 Tax=Brachionus calyciflorus TaxID=104777 RepID=A0A813SZZ0_9BILA|nr:unnamed protein product [Brachionus calyciflorus]
MYPELEDVLFIWFHEKREHGAIISDEILIEKAKYFGTMLNISNFKYSDGWINKFKKRYNISSYKLHGEAGSVDQNEINSERLKLQNELKEFNLDDIYNLDETALFFKMEPNKTLSDKKESDKKIDKTRITVALCCNASGRDKIKPLVIGRFKNPRCFKNFNPEPVVSYFNNSIAWMTASIFSSWCETFNNNIKFKNEKRKVVLLVDNASGHKPVVLSNVIIKFLPPNTTSCLQPLDAGIINSFKAQYRKGLVKSFIESLDDFNELKTPDLKDAIYLINRAWKSVTVSTIKKCWNKCNILEQLVLDDLEDDKFLKELDEFLLKLKIKYDKCDMSAEEYLNLESLEVTSEELSDEEIVKILLFKLNLILKKIK